MVPAPGRTPDKKTKQYKNPDFSLGLSRGRSVDMFTFCNLAILVTSLFLVVNATPPVQPTPDLGTVFAVYPGWNMLNGGSSPVFGGTELQCIQACSADPSCVAYAYAPYGSGPTAIPGPNCIIKPTIDLTTFRIGTFDATVGLIGACGTFVPTGPTNCFTVPVP
ncbi:hypothetical protein MVEN_00917300 [Mycena venus]|uniref:Apple domain-containing protein n=1 Tax=Mycena venus TaxID=2733690 RepID=A0A8H7D1R3_9AGAR|nr:hypothetical protein MVEN_00917300 [Mycena venus]